MWYLLDVCGVEYLVEYNVGYLYVVKFVLWIYYEKFDLINSFNVGIG